MRIIATLLITFAVVAALLSSWRAVHAAALPRMQALELTPGGAGAKLMRRSASPRRVSLDAGQAAMETLLLRSQREALTVSSVGRVASRALQGWAVDNVLNIKMVLDYSTGQPFLLPGDKASDRTEFKFLIRSHFGHMYICMNDTADVYTTKVESGRLPEDCLWRGRLLTGLPLPDRSPRNPSGQFAAATFYRAILPPDDSRPNKTMPSQRRQERWYLGIGSDGYAANGRALRGRSESVVFMVEEWQRWRPREDQRIGSFLDQSETNRREASGSDLPHERVEVGAGRLVRVEAESLNSAIRRRLRDGEAGGGAGLREICSAARAAAEAHAVERAGLTKRVRRQLRRLRAKLRALAGPAAVRLANRYFNYDLALGFLDDNARGGGGGTGGGRRRRHRRRKKLVCRRDWLTLAFQSERVARRLVEHECPAMAAGGSRALRARRRRRRRIRRALMRLLPRPNVDERGGRGSLLTALRLTLNVSLSSRAEIREALLRRRAEKDERRRQLSAETVGNLDEQLRLAWLEDSVNFAVAVRHARPNNLLPKTRKSHPKQFKRQKRPLLTPRKLTKLQAKWKSFPKFYSYLGCD